MHTFYEVSCSNQWSRWYPLLHQYPCHWWSKGARLQPHPPPTRPNLLQTRLYEDLGKHQQYKDLRFSAQILDLMVVHINVPVLVQMGAYTPFFKYKKIKRGWESISWEFFRSNVAILVVQKSDSNEHVKCLSIVSYSIKTCQNNQSSFFESNESGFERFIIILLLLACCYNLFMSSLVRYKMGKGEK